MLAGLGKNVRSILTKLLMGILAIAFIVWGIGDIFRNNSTEVIAKVGGHKISYQEYRASMERVLQNIQQSYGSSVTLEDLSKVGEDLRILQQMINDTLLSKRLESLYFSVGDEIVRPFITSIPDFHNEKGEFDQALFKRILASNGLNEKKYVEGLRTRISLDLFLKSFLVTPQAPDLLVYPLFLYQFEQRLVNLLVIPQSAIGEIKDPTDTDLVQFYNDHNSYFEVPELRKVSYITLHPDKIKGKVVLSDEEVKQYYATHLDEFTVSDSRDVDQYLSDNKKAAQEIYEALTLKETPKATKMPLGAVSKEGLLPEVADTVFTLENGQFTKPIKTDLGWHVFVVNKVTKAHAKSLEDVKDTIHTELQSTKEVEAFYEYINRLEDELSAGLTLEELAKEAKISVENLGPISQEGKNAKGELVKKIPDPEIFLPLIFNQDVGVESPLTSLSDNQSFVVAKVEQIFPNRVKPLDEIRGHVRDLWLEAEEKKELANLARQTKEKVAQGQTTIETLSTQEGYQAYHELAVKRSGNEPFNQKQTLPDYLVRDIFSLNQKGVSNIYPLENGDYLFAQLVEIKKPNKEKQPKEYQVMIENYQQNFFDDVMSQYTTYLGELYPVSINEEMLKKNRGQQQLAE